jgi:hypothetical protein
VCKPHFDLGDYLVDLRKKYKHRPAQFSSNQAYVTNTKEAKVHIFNRKGVAACRTKNGFNGIQFIVGNDMTSLSRNREEMTKYFIARINIIL